MACLQQITKCSVITCSGMISRTRKLIYHHCLKHMGLSIKDNTKRTRGRKGRWHDPLITIMMKMIPCHNSGKLWRPPHCLCAGRLTWIQSWSKTGCKHCSVQLLSVCALSTANASLCISTVTFSHFCDPLSPCCLFSVSCSLFCCFPFLVPVA